MQNQEKKQETIKLLIILVALIAVILVLTLSSQPSKQRDTLPAENNSQVAASATLTTRPTNTLPPGPFGVDIDFDYENSRIQDEINERTFRNTVPSFWIAGSNVDAGYRLEFEFSSGRSYRCTGYTNYISNRDLTLTYTAIDLTVTVIDLLPDDNKAILTETFSPDLPDDCPYTYEFEASTYGVPQDTTEYVTPRTFDVDSWLRENVRSLPNMPATSTPRPTQTLTPTATATATSTPIAENSLIVTGTINIRDANGEVIVTVNEGEYTLLGIESEKYVILYNGEQGYVPIISNNAHPEQNITISDSLIIDDVVIIRNEEGRQIARETSGEYILLGIEESYYIIQYEGAQGYIHTSSNFVTQSTIVMVDDAAPIPRTPLIVPTSTPFTENALIITGEVFILDSNDSQIATVSEGELPLIGLVDDKYIILYEGDRAFVDVASPDAQAEQELAPRELLTFTGTVIVRDENGAQIAMESAGQYGLIAIEGDNYIIDYNGQQAYVFITSTNATVSTGIISDTSPQATSMPTSIANVTSVIQSDYFGVEVTTTYALEHFQREIRESRYTASVPSDWMAIDGIAPRYRIELYFNSGQSNRCDGYSELFSTETLTLTYRAIDMQVRVIDLAALNQPEILRENFTTSVPDDCPLTYSFDVSGGEFQNTTEFKLPRSTALRSWLNENLYSLSDMPPTVTPTAIPTMTPTATATSTLSPTPSRQSISDSEASATPPGTELSPPVDFPILTINADTIVYDESGDVIGMADRGDYLLADLNTENYIIIFEGNHGYIPRETSDIEPAFSQNILWEIRVTGLVLLRDENTNELARITEGEFQLLLVEGDYYIIDYNGVESYVHITSTNARLVYTIVDSE